MPGRIEVLRRNYHRRIAREVLRMPASGIPSNADKGSASSVRIAKGIVERIGLPLKSERLAGQTAGRRFEEATRRFLRDAFGLLSHLRPGQWEFAIGGDIRDYEQYLHLSDIRRVVEQHEELRIIFGDYIVTPDIGVCRKPVSDSDINKNEAIYWRTTQWPNIRLCVAQIRVRASCTRACLANGRFAAIVLKTHVQRL